MKRGGFLCACGLRLHPERSFITCKRCGQTWRHDDCGCCFRKGEPRFRIKDGKVKSEQAMSFGVLAVPQRHWKSPRVPFVIGMCAVAGELLKQPYPTKAGGAS